MEFGTVEMMRRDVRIIVSALCACVAGLPVVHGDRNSDYWSPESMAVRQCTSVHLVYLPNLPRHTAAYQEVVVEKSAPGTYFACNNFTDGYIGVQELGRKDEKGQPIRVAIFSVWDAKETGDNPHAAPEEERAKLVSHGEGVVVERFGGEGTGGKSMRRFDWREGEVIRTLVVERKDGEDFRRIAGYIFNPTVAKWELLSCWRIQAVRQGLGNSCGFVEDFMRNVESKSNERRATFGPVFRWDGSAWHQATQFRFTRDANPNNNINCRLNPHRGYFSLATGGDIVPGEDFPPFDVRTLDPLPHATEPGEEVMRIIRDEQAELTHAAQCTDAKDNH